jgi:hypothetical protein
MRMISIARIINAMISKLGEIVSIMVYRVFPDYRLRDK